MRVTNQARLLSSPRVSTATAPGLKSTSGGRSHSIRCAVPSLVESELSKDPVVVVELLTSCACAAPGLTMSKPQIVKADFQTVLPRIAFLRSRLDAPVAAAEAGNHVTSASRIPTRSQHPEGNADAKFVSGRRCTRDPPRPRC